MTAVSSALVVRSESIATPAALSVMNNAPA
jgi:hypothetical protein